MRPVIGVVVAALAANSSGAEELVPGTVIDESNIEDLANFTFEGVTVSELVPSPLRALVGHGLRLPLRHSAPVPIDERYRTLSETYSQEVEYDPQSGTVSGYVAGIPFPDVQNDPSKELSPKDAGLKLIWNNFFANPTTGDNYSLKDGDILHIRGDTPGIERSQKLYATKIRMIGRLTEPHVLGDGSINKQQMLFLLAPYDVRGLGQYIVRYNDGRPDETYAYIKSVRRVRRVSGNTWMDSVGGGDWANEDPSLLDIHPLWYKEFNFIGETRTLAVAHAPAVPFELDRFIDNKKPPHWNPIGVEWEPRRTYVIEGVPPREHVYGKKTLWMEKDYPSLYMMQVDDKKGELWKVGLNFSHPSTPEESDVPAIGEQMGLFVDLQRMHATVVTASGIKINRPGVELEDFSVSEMVKLVR
jgi:hypothetical protein